jgi:uncharacterized membrane protein
MSRLKRISLCVMALFYVAGGVRHFLVADFYLALMPPYLPWHSALVTLSGLAEIALGVGLLVPRTRVLAAWGVIALLVAVFPANVHAATAGIEGAGGYLRLPLQAVFIAWAWWHTRRADHFAPDPTRMSPASVSSSGSRENGGRAR